MVESGEKRNGVQGGKEKKNEKLRGREGRKRDGGEGKIERGKRKGVREKRRREEGRVGG
jgi:hypothetical protein